MTGLISTRPALLTLSHQGGSLVLLIEPLSMPSCLSFSAWTARKNVFPQLHLFRTTNIVTEFHNEYYKIYNPTALPKLFFFFFSWISQISQWQKPYLTATTRLHIMIFSNVLLLTSKLSLVLTRANKLWSNSRIIIFCHLWESEMQKWRWDRIHGYTRRSSKEIYQVDAHTGSKPACPSCPQNSKKIWSRENYETLSLLFLP